MIFEIVNPSDKCTLEAFDHEVAAIACVLIGNGKYALDGIDTKLEVPIFMFGGHDEWFTETFGRNVSDSLGYIKANKANELITCLNSVMLGSAESRASFKKGLELITDAEKREEWRQHWLNERRTSLNNICQFAWDYAKELEKQWNKQPPAEVAKFLPKEA